MTEETSRWIAEALKLANIGFYSYTFDGTIIAFDRVTYDFFELDGIYEDPESVVGENIESLFIYIGAKGRLRQEITSKGSVSNFEYCIRTLKNNEKWGIHNSYMYYDKNVKKDAIQTCFYDITQRKMLEKERIEESEQRYKTLFEHSPDSIMILDLETRIIECNRATSELFELGFENIIRQRFEGLEILDRTQINRYRIMFKRLLNGEDVDVIELELILNSGRQKWIELFPRMIFHNGEPTSIQIISRDITERKHAELEMKKQLMKYDLDIGNLYLSKEPRPNKSIDAFKELLMLGHSGTLISRQSKDYYQNIVGYKFDHVKISEMGPGNHVPPSYNSIHGIMAKLPRGEIVHMDCIEYLISRIGPKQTLKLIQYLKDLAVSKNLCAIITVDPVAVPVLEMELIEKESRFLLPSKSLAGLSTKLIDTLQYIDELNKENTKPSYSEIGKRFQLSKPTTRARIKQLLELGTVREIHEGRKKVLEVTEKGKNYLAQ